MKNNFGAIPWVGHLHCSHGHTLGSFVRTSCPTLGHLTLSEKKMSNARGGGGMNALGTQSHKVNPLESRNFSHQLWLTSFIFAGFSILNKVINQFFSISLITILAQQGQAYIR